MNTVPTPITPEQAQAGLDFLKAQCALLRTSLARIEGLIATLTAQHAADLINNLPAPEPDDPNTRPYMLTWTADSAPCVQPGTRRTTFTLAEAMRIAGFEAVTVTDALTVRVLWIGSEATR